MLLNKYQGSMPCGFRQEDFFHVFPIQAYVKHMTHGAGQFWPQEHNFNKLGRGPLDDALYLVVSDKILFMFSLYKPM